jgi:hypothetical protein
MTTNNTSSNIGFIDLVRNGFWFYFSHNNHEFAAHASGVSGRESIYIDDSKVSEKISWRFRSAHEFNHDGHHYRIEFNLKSAWRGQLVCHFYVDGILLETTEFGMAVNSKVGWTSIVILFVIGMVFGYLGAYVAVSML